jgi:DNA-binding NarL/FixJ family response regulator
MTTATASYRDRWTPTGRPPLRLAEPDRRPPAPVREVPSRGVPTPRTLPPELSRLTERELTVLRAMATGASNAEIASDLYLSVATVKTHVARVLAKLGLRDRVQAVVFAYESRLVVPR